MPLEIMTDYGSQFNKKKLEGYATLSGVKHHASTPFSKEENYMASKSCGARFKTSS